jgi:hypothetical protein
VIRLHLGRLIDDKITAVSEMNAQALIDTARMLVAGNKGLLAMDLSLTTSIPPLTKPAAWQRQDNTKYETQ